MAAGFLALLDDIAALMDDVAITAKVATKQTAGILGDDLAVNAQKATGFHSSREVLVLMKIMRGSFINKLIIIPIAFVLQVLYPPAINVILVLGGLYLAFEGVEKIIEFIHLRNQKRIGKTVLEIAEEPNISEDEKVKSAVMTDFILSIEIVIIALGTVLKEPLLTQIITVSIVSIIATVGVYGIVALIVRMDDAGFKLIRTSKNYKSFRARVGKTLVRALPVIIKALGVIGTIALILVAGGIFEHNLDFLHNILPNWNALPRQFLFGIAAGILMLPIGFLAEKIFEKKKVAAEKP